jgi:hypothetical protein
LFVDGCQFVGFSANKGGAIAGTGVGINIKGSSFVGNNAVVNGGAVDIYTPNGLIENCTFLGNRANLGGAASLAA